MDSTDSSILDSRRSLRAILVKLLVVNFTTFSFYFHFHHQREGVYLSLDCVAFFFSPLNLIFRYLAALAGIIGFAGFHLITSAYADDPVLHRQETYNQVKTALIILFGKSPNGVDYELPFPVPSLDNVESSNHSNHVPLSERIAQQLRWLLPLAIFLAQCVGAIFLYHRRQQRAGVTQIDEQIFRLACSGLLVGLLSGCYTLNLPYFNKTAPFERETKLEDFVFFLRDNGRGSFWLLHILRSLFISFCIHIMLRYPPLLESYLPAWDGAGPMLFVFAVIVSIIVAMTATTSAKDSWPKRLLKKVLWGLVYLCMSVGCVAVFHGVIAMLPLHWSFYPIAIWEIVELQTIPLDQPCPMLWSDPVSEYVWWLA